MPVFKPFAGLRYDTEKAGPLEALLAPPYDVMGPAERDAFAAGSEHNVVRLILPDGPVEGDSTRYDRAASLLAEWRASGALVPDENPAFYLYGQTFLAAGAVHKRHGVVGLLALEPLGEGGVYPHERTLPGHVLDRLELVRHTRSNLSQILLIAADGDKSLLDAVESLASSGAPGYEVEGPGGVTERLSVIEDESLTSLVTASLADDCLYIADGHHRYETALKYQAETGASGCEPAAHIPVVVCSMHEPGLVILPTHRVVDAPAGMSPDDLLELLADSFDSKPISAGEAEALAAETDGAPTFALCAKGLETPVRLTLRDRTALDAMAPERSDDWRGLDVTVLHELILTGHLGFTSDRLLAKDGIDFIKDAGEAMNAAVANDGRFAFVMRATRMDQLRAVAGHCELMPQKSTFFYPKLTTGHVIRAMDL